MTDLDTMFYTFTTITAICLAIAFIAYPLWFFLHAILCPKLDPLLFREPYFEKMELVNYLYWPLSAIRSLNYIGLIATPSLAKRKRFKGMYSSLPVGRGITSLQSANYSFTARDFDDVYLLRIWWCGGTTCHLAYTGLAKAILNLRFINDQH